MCFDLENRFEYNQEIFDDGSITKWQNIINNEKGIGNYLNPNDGHWEDTSMLFIFKYYADEDAKDRQYYSIFAIR